jgi:hypothetical protein
MRRRERSLIRDWSLVRSRTMLRRPARHQQLARRIMFKPRLPRATAD